MEQPKPMSIERAVEMAFEAIRKEEISVNDLAKHIKYSIPAYDMEASLDVIQRRVSAHLSNAAKKKTKYTHAINPKTKKNKKGVYRLVRTTKPETIFRVDPTLQPLPFPKTVRKRRNPLITESIPTSPKPENSADNDFESPAVKKLYFGKASEFAVASELIFRGYNASIMSVDEGVDITASKKNLFYFIQVKSTWLDDKKQLSVTLKPNRFQNATNASLYYVIVVRYVSKGVLTNRYIIFSQEDLQRYKFDRFIKETTSGLTIKIKEEAGQLWLYDDDKKHGIEYHLDHFELIK